MKFGQLILRKIFKFFAIRCEIFRAKMHQTQYRLRGSAPADRTGGAYSALQAF